MGAAGKHVAILVHNYFEQAEFEEPMNALKDAGVAVTVISADKKALRGMKHVELGDKFEADLLLDQASAEDYDALVLPGGAINADNLRVVETAQRWAVDFMDAGKPLAVICHAPWVLVSAGAAEGRRLTSYHTIRDDIVNAGGEWVNQPLVMDDSLITSRKPDDLPQFNEALISLLDRSQADKLSSVGSAVDRSRDEDDDDEDDDAEDVEELRLSGVNIHDEKGDTY
ncbi:MAG: type 1 glutamine amidotransferase domain-containing protein [Candidatus Saccharibacteria bacterium]